MQTRTKFCYLLQHTPHVAGTKFKLIISLRPLERTRPPSFAASNHDRFAGSLLSELAFAVIALPNVDVPPAMFSDPFLIDMQFRPLKLTSRKTDKCILPLTSLLSLSSLLGLLASEWGVLIGGHDEEVLSIVSGRWKESYGGLFDFTAASRPI